MDPQELESLLNEKAPEILEALDAYKGAHWRAVRADFNAASHQTRHDFDLAECAEEEADKARNALLETIASFLFPVHTWLSL